VDAGAEAPRDIGINYDVEVDTSPSDNFGGVAAFRTDGTAAPGM